MRFPEEQPQWLGYENQAYCETLGGVGHHPPKVLNPEGELETCFPLNITI